ncbi:MAG: hypothetical protein R3182_01460, partial [Draconibacterium sp.]|nr:hypothetical protein [Draconibacterium sp.]
DILNQLRNNMELTRTQTKDYLPNRRTPDEFDRESGMPNKYRIRPRPSKKEMWRIFEREKK